MNKRYNLQYLYAIATFGLLIFCIINLSRKIYYPSITATSLLIFNIINLIKYKDNKKIFFISLMLFYFNYSIVICKYLFGGTELLEKLYIQLFYTDTMGLAINLLLLFNIIIFIPICLYTKSNNNEKNITLKSNGFNNIQYKQIILFLFKIIIIGVIFYHIYKKITYNTTIFEYLFIIFIFAFLISKGNIKEQRSFEILLVICCIYSLYVGERIGVLQFLISDFIINYLDKFKIKTISIITACGIFFFTFMGVYGDILDSTGKFEELTVHNVIEAFSERRFALDTSVSAYFTSTSIIEISRITGFKEKIDNLKDYCTKYIIKGTKSDYIDLTRIARKYQVNYGGGYITGFFYYWLGVIGVIGVSLYIGFILRKIMKSEKASSYFIAAYSVFFITSLPRWYMYNPNLLFRGSLIFIILYNALSIFIKKSTKNNETIKLEE